MTLPFPFFSFYTSADRVRTGQATIGPLNQHQRNKLVHQIEIVLAVRPSSFLVESKVWRLFNGQGPRLVFHSTVISSFYGHHHIIILDNNTYRFVLLIRLKDQFKWFLGKWSIIFIHFARNEFRLNEIWHITVKSNFIWCFHFLRPTKTSLHLARVVTLVFDWIQEATKSVLLQ